jgi:plasmid maintenance system killer protein
MEHFLLLNVKFRANYLKTCFHKKNESVKKWGEQVGKLYIKRLNMVYATETVKDLYNIPQLHFHPLKGDLKKYHSITITGRARIYVTVEDNNTITIEKVNLEHYE